MAYAAKTATPQQDSTYYRPISITPCSAELNIGARHRQEFSVSQPFDAHCCHMGTAVKHPVPDQVKPAFVIFDIRALWRWALSVRAQGSASESSDVKNYKWRL